MVRGPNWRCSVRGRASLSAAAAGAAVVPGAAALPDGAAVLGAAAVMAAPAMAARVQPQPVLASATEARGQDTDIKRAFCAHNLISGNTQAPVQEER